MTDEPWVLAIDFGTSFTVAASRVGERAAEVIEIDGERRLPSLIVVDDDGAVRVGRAAETIAGASPGRVLRAPKSRLGEPAPVVLGGRAHPITALVADLLRHVYEEAIRYHGRPPHEVRLTHPATWSGPRRQQLVAAAELAGIEQPVLVPEPVAAAIAYADDGAVPAQGHVLVYDLGGGTFDTAVLQASPDGFVVVGRPGGDPRLGGELFDELLANAIGERLDQRVYERIQLAEDALWQQAAAGLVRESRRVKEALSTHPYADVLLGLPDGLVQQRIEQRDLARIIGPYVDETVAVMLQTAEGAGLDAAALSSIYLVGGASRTPLVGESVASAFPGVPLSRRGDPKGVVAVGATHPRATPTFLAQRSSLDRAITIERPGPPPVATVLGTLIDPPGGEPATVIETVIETVRPTVVDTGGTVVERPTGAAPPAPRDRRPLVLGAIAAVLVLLVGAVIVATQGGDGGEEAVPTTTGQPRPAGGVVTVPGGTASSPPTPPATPPVTTPATVPPATVPTVPPATVPTVPPATVPPATVAPPTPGPTRAQLEASLITAAELPDGAWAEIPFVEGPPFCGATAETGLVDEVTKQFQIAGAPLPVIAHSASTYDTAANAAAEFTAATEALTNCSATTYDLEGFTYAMQTGVTPVTPADVPLPCSDQAALLTVTLTSADSPIPFLGQYTIAIRCGVNIVVVSVGTDQLTADPPASFIDATTLAAVRIAALPGSTA